MHELSIAQSIIESVSEAARNARAERVTSVHLRVGKLAGLVTDSLLFCFDISTRDTMLAGATLQVDELPVILYCDRCEKAFELPGIQRFRCPLCDEPSADIRQGRELEIASIEVEP